MNLQYRAISYIFILQRNTFCVIFIFIPLYLVIMTPCTWRAHFHSQVHDFRRCALGVCSFFVPFIIAICWEGAWSNFRVHSFMGSAQNKAH